MSVPFILFCNGFCSEALAGKVPPLALDMSISCGDSASLPPSAGIAEFRACVLRPTAIWMGPREARDSSPHSNVMTFLGLPLAERERQGKRMTDAIMSVL